MESLCRFTGAPPPRHRNFSNYHSSCSILGPFSVDTELLHCFVNASLFYMLATRVHVHELQTANRFKWPIRGGGGGHVMETNKNYKGLGTTEKEKKQEETQTGR